MRRVRNCPQDIALLRSKQLKYAVHDVGPPLNHAPPAARHPYINAQTTLKAHNQGRVKQGDESVGTLKTTLTCLGGLCALLALPLMGAAFLDTSQGSAAAAGLSDAVPAEYRDLVKKAGSTCEGITAPLIAAQIEAESNWNPNAGSPVGAQGISQFMPSTWASVGKDHNGDGKADVLDPADAIPSQGQYMCDQLANVDALLASGKVSGDRIDLTLAAYNAGLGAVSEHGGIPPFKETRDYVTKIKGLMTKYAAATVSGDVATALEWAKGIAADDSHGYTLGATGPSDYDCSGLTLTFMKQLGIDLPRTAHEQATSSLGTPVASLDEAKPGDLLFWFSGPEGRYYHAAIYAGDGKMVSADNEQLGIQYEDIWGRESVTVRRFIN